jgi:O-acetyl-ADP-ribose deacetylase (regulator of RNase III)
VIRVVVDDLAFVTADAVVRPTTALLEPVSPALRRLEQVGGPAFWRQLETTVRLAVGAAVVTAGGDLPAEFVIHAVVRSEDEAVSSAGIRRAINSVIQRAGDWELSAIAIPLLGTGPGNLDLEDAARLLVDTLVEQTARATYPREVSIVVESDAERAVVEACLKRRAVS